MTKNQMQSEITRLREENRILKKRIEQLSDLNKVAFKRQHEAEGRLNLLYSELSNE